VDASDLQLRFDAALATAPPLAFAEVDSAPLVEQERGWWRALVRQTVGVAAAAPGLDACFAELYAHYARPQAWRVFPEACAALAALRAAGFRLAVVSNFDGRLQGLVAGLGLAPFLDLVVHSSAAGAAKPDPGIFHHALDGLGVARAAALHVGDSVRADVEGARAAGLRAVLLDRGHGRPRVSRDVPVIETLAELPGLAAAIGSGP
jgi:putative hydrolase of the HAD superfamily